MRADGQYASGGHGHQHMFMGSAVSQPGFNKSSSGKIHFQIINNYNVNINNNYPEANGAQGSHPQAPMQMSGQHAQPGLNTGGQQQPQGGPTAIRVSWNAAGPGPINHQLQNQQTLPFVIEGLENVTDPQVQERLLQELQRPQVHNNYQHSGANTQSSVTQSPIPTEARVDGLQQQTRISIGNVKKGHSGERGGVPDRIQAQQSQQSFLPYEENGSKRNELTGHAAAHPSSGKSNSSSGNAVQKIGSSSHPRSGTSNNPFSGPLVGPNEGQVALHTQGSVANGLQYSENYQQSNNGQQTAPFRRKASNTNKQSLTHLKNQSLQHEDAAEALEDAGIQEGISRQRMQGTNSHGVESHGSNTGANKTGQGICLNSESIGARGGAAGDKINTGSIQLARIGVNKQHPQIAGIGINYNKGGGTFVAPKGLASVNRGGNKYINSKNANAGKGQFGGGAHHQNTHQSNSLGRDSLKSGGGLVNFDQSVGSGISGSQGPVPHVVGLVSQQHSLKGAGGHQINTAGQQYGRPSGGGGGMGTAPGNAYNMNEFRDNSKQKHSEDNQHGNSQPRKYDSFDEENPYNPYQNQIKGGQAAGANSSTMNSRINQLQSSLNSGLNGLATGGSFVGGPQALNANSRGAREGSGPSHTIKGGKSVGPPVGTDLNGQNPNNMKLLQDHAHGGMPQLLNKNGISNNGDYSNTSNKGSLNSFKGAGYNRKMSPDKSIPMIKQVHQPYAMGQPGGGMMGSAGHYYAHPVGGQSNSSGDAVANIDKINISQPKINVVKHQPKNKFDAKNNRPNGREDSAHTQGPKPSDQQFQPHLNQSQNFQGSGSKDNGRIINRSLNKGGINNNQERMQMRQKYENGSQISSTSFNKALGFALPASAALNSKNSGADSKKLKNVRGGTHHQNQRAGLTQNNFDKCNPVCNDEDDLDEDVYETEEFETVEPIAQNYGGQDGQQNRGQSGAPGTNNSQNMGNNTFYAGQQNAKFFDKRMLASQKQSRPKNTFGPTFQADMDQSSQGQSGYSPHIKQQRQGKKNHNAQAQRAAGQGGAVRPSVNESMLPSLSRTGNNFNPLIAGTNPRKGEGVNGQRVASRRTSTRQKADMQGARIIHSRQRQDQFMNEHPQNVYTLNMNNEKMSPDQSHSKIPITSYNHSQPRGQTQGSIHQGSMTHKKNNMNNFKIKQLPLELQGKEMENEAREHLNLAQYNFNRMAVIQEEGEVGYQGGGGGGGRGGGAARRSTRGVNDQLMSAGQDRRGSKNMHNTTTNFYHKGFGDRLPTRGDVQSRGRQNLIPSAQGTRRGNSRAENSFGRVQQIQVNQQTANKGGTHYGCMFQESTQKSLISMPGPGIGLTQQNSNNRNNNDQESTNQGGRNASIGMALNSKSIPLQKQNKSRVRISTESMQNINNHQQPGNYPNHSYQPNTVNAIRETSKRPGGRGGDNGDDKVRRNSQMNERDNGSIGRASGNGANGLFQGQPSGMNLGNFDEFDQYSNGNNGNQFDPHGFDNHAKLDSGRGVSSGFNKNSAVDGFMAHNHMFDIEEDEDNEDQFNDAQYQ